MHELYDYVAKIAHDLVGQEMFGMTRSFRLVLSCTLILLAFALRIVGLQSDPPSMNILPDQAPWTDEGTLSLPSIETIRGQSLSDGLVQSGRPLHVLALSVVFDVLGVGRFQGRLVSVAVGLLGLVMLTRVAALVSFPGAILALVFGSSGFFFVVYGRLILTEGLVVAALCLVAWLGIRARSPLGALSVGVLLCLVAVSLKLLALVLVPGLTLLYLLRRRHLLLPFLFGLLIIVVVWLIVWITGHQSYIGYVQARVSGELLGIAPPEVVVLQMLLAGSPLYFLPYQLPLFIMASFELLACLLAPRQWLRESPDAILVASAWLLAIVIAVGLFRYTPPRYYHLASPALILLSVAGAKRLWHGEAFPSARAIIRIACAASLGLVMIGQLGSTLSIFGEWAFWIPLLGLLFPLLFLWLSAQNKTGWGWTSRRRLILLSVLIGLQLLEQGWLYAAGLVPIHMDLPQAANALARLVPQNAIIVGRLAGTLALLAPVQGSVITDWIDRDAILQLARTRSVWIVVLAEYESDVDPRLRSSFSSSVNFPVNYSSKSRWFTVYEFNPQEIDSQ